VHLNPDFPGDFRESMSLAMEWGMRLKGWSVVTGWWMRKSTGEDRTAKLRVGFDRRLQLEFHDDTGHSEARPRLR
jgi:hypothetical protein